MEGIMYINASRVKIKKVKNEILLAVGIAGLIIFGGTFIFCLFENEYNSEVISFIFMMISILIIYKAIKNRTIISSIYFYYRYFEGDLNGYINISDMVNVIGKSENEIKNELTKLLKKKYMENFIIKQNQEGYQVILQSKTEKFECKNCGAIINKSVHFTRTCPYCGGSDLFAKLIKKEENR
jgi:Zn finger protein HypA/HybF involved in hydrogenase expression